MSEKGDKEDSLDACVFTLIDVIFLTPLAMLFRAYVVQLGWGWFLAPVVDIQAPALLPILGLLLLLRLMGRFPDIKSRSAFETLYRTVTNFLATAVALGLLWFLHLYS